MSTSYFKTYSVLNDTTNGLVDSESLTYEYQESEITVALSNISVSDDVLTIYSKAAILGDDITEMDNMVAAHEGVETLNKDIVEIAQEDKENHAIKTTEIGGLPGQKQRVHEVEFETCKINSIHDKDYNDQDYGWSSLCFFKDVNGVETLMESPTQEEIDSDCIRTDYHFEPDIMFRIKSAYVRQMTVPLENIYFWGLMANTTIPLPGLPIEVLGGGMNLCFYEKLQQFGVEGTSPSTIYPNGIWDDITGSLITHVPDGQGGYLDLENFGTSRITFIFRHSAGFKHRINTVFEIFR